MGNKAGKSKKPSSSAVPDSDEFWWLEADSTFAPIGSCDEFCRRFHATPAGYKESVALFNDMIANGPEEGRGKPHLTLGAWLRAVPEGDTVKQWVTNIWNCFDVDSNGIMTLDEWLVYDGIRKFGTLEQRVMGSFILFDPDHDRKIRREEIGTMMKAASSISGIELSEEKFKVCLDTLINVVDVDKSETLELSEVIRAARANPSIAKIFNAV